MAKQLVLSGNRVIAHGEDCFLCMGGTVICPESGRVYQNATVANVEGGIPADIDEVGYEYHAGEFVPCAPYGKGAGNIAVVCNDDCKSIKDSGISSEQISRVSQFTYTGTGTSSNTLTFDFFPRVVFVTAEATAANLQYYHTALIIGTYGIAFDWSTNTNVATLKLKVTVSDNTISYSCIDMTTAPNCQNNKNTKYYVYAIG